jgi:hypothetical protein
MFAATIPHRAEKERYVIPDVTLIEEFEKAEKP